MQIDEDWMSLSVEEFARREAEEERLRFLTHLPTIGSRGDMVQQRVWAKEMFHALVKCRGFDFAKAVRRERRRLFSEEFKAQEELAGSVVPWTEQEKQGYVDFCLPEMED